MNSSALEQARAALDGGDLIQAVERFEHALRAGVERVERPALLEGLALAYGRSGRFFECSVVARDLVSHLDPATTPAATRARALAILVGGLINAEAALRAAGPLAELERLVPDLDEAEHARTIRLALHARFSLSILAEDLPRAEAALDGIRDLLTRGLLDAAEGQLLRHAEFHLRMAQRDVRAMEDLLRQLTDEQSPRNVYVPEITIRVGLATALAEQGRLAAARTHVRQVMQWIREHESTGSASDTVLGDASTLVALCAGPLDDPESAQELAGLLTRAVIERLQHLQHSAELLNGLFGGDEPQLLEDMREDFMSAHVEFLRGVRERLTVRAPGASTGVAAVPLGSEMLRVCAWCGSVNAALDQWIPLGSFVPRGPIPRVTHGICPACMPAHWAFDSAPLPKQGP